MMATTDSRARPWRHSIPVSLQWVRHPDVAVAAVVLAGGASMTAGATFRGQDGLHLVPEGPAMGSILGLAFSALFVAVAATAAVRRVVPDQHARKVAVLALVGGAAGLVATIAMAMPSGCGKPPSSGMCGNAAAYRYLLVMIPAGLGGVLVVFGTGLLAAQSTRQEADRIRNVGLVWAAAAASLAWLEPFVITNPFWEYSAPHVDAFTGAAPSALMLAEAVSTLWWSAVGLCLLAGCAMVAWSLAFVPPPLWLRSYHGLVAALGLFLPSIIFAIPLVVGPLTESSTGISAGMASYWLSPLVWWLLLVPVVIPVSGVFVQERTKWLASRLYAHGRISEVAYAHFRRPERSSLDVVRHMAYLLVSGGVLFNAWLVLTWAGPWAVAAPVAASGVLGGVLTIVLGVCLQSSLPTPQNHRNELLRLANRGFVAGPDAGVRAPIHEPEH